jgi:hypothetical protein
LVRWELQPADIEGFLRGPLLRLLRTPTMTRCATGHCVSRQAGGVVWFTAFASPADVETLRTAISDWLGEEAASQGPSHDGILAAHLCWYRASLQQVCEIALDLLHDGIDRRTRDVLRTVRDPGDPAFFPVPAAGDAYKMALEPVLVRARPYSELGPYADGEFWSAFSRWPGGPDHDQLRPPGHWLWNVLGV